MAEDSIRLAVIVIWLVTSLLTLASIARALPKSAWVKFPSMMVIWIAQTVVAIKLGGVSILSLAFISAVPMLAALVRTRGHLERLADPRRIAGDPALSKNSMTQYEKKMFTFVLVFLIAAGAVAVSLGDLILPS